ncbi:hypothetical protein KJ781_00515 [Patescibacteria group bacterium]|nr:hypothetical protein [Patescibacteria group bacterium]MBU1448434.1 hypothetical protein [Patescibacteria group bacterium]MBU2612870.1 hypothetical protein [Patescibacteria group bacterium]
MTSDTPKRDPLVARTTEKLLAWAEILLAAARHNHADLIFAYDDVIDELSNERAQLREEYLCFRCTEPPPSLTVRPTAPPRTDTLPSPPALPVIATNRARRPVKKQKPKRRTTRPR